MIPNDRIFRSRRGASLWHLGITVLTLNAAAADALDTWTSHMFPEVRVSFPGISCVQYTTNGIRTVTNAIPWLNKVLFKDGLFVAVGTGPCQQDTPTVIMRSVDGLNWDRSTNQGYNGFYGATVTPDLFVGVGFWGQVLLSENGVEWGGRGPNFDYNLYDVAFGSNSFVAMSGRSAVVWPYGTTGVIFTTTVTSTNISNWAEANVFGSSAGEFVTVAYGNGRFFAATPSRIFRSMGTPGTATNFLQWGLVQGARRLCFGNNRFVLAGSNLRVCTDVNGSFLSVPSPTSNQIDALTFGAGMFVATAGRDVATSVDGFNWTVRTNALPGRASDLTFGNGAFMAVGVPPDSFTGNGYYLSQPVAKVSPAANGGLLVEGVEGREYDILGTNSLTASSWPVLTRIRLTNSPQPWVDENPTSFTNAVRFYRTRLVP